MGAGKSDHTYVVFVTRKNKITANGNHVLRALTLTNQSCDTLHIELSSDR